MTDRKFTPPAEFPAEYVTRDGCKAVILGRMPNETFVFVGYVDTRTELNSGAISCTWTARGRVYSNGNWAGHDLYDLPKKHVHWANDYASSSSNMWYGSRNQADRVADSHRIAVIRREWIEGQPPQYFTEEV